MSDTLVDVGGLELDNHQTKEFYMPATDLSPDAARTAGPRVAARRLTTETKAFFKTSEFWTYVVAATAILIAGSAVGSGGNRDDFFAADKVWLYITILTVGYLVSRGIAKSGVRDPYTDHSDGYNGRDAA
jgi:hypothetical protein